MSEVHQQALAIETLVRDRCVELGLKPVELVRRCGYQNASKGLRRLEQLRTGDFARTSGLLRTLPAALQVPVDVVEAAIQATQRYLHEATEAAWRAAFRPHAVIITERTIPQPIFMACMIGVDTLLRVDFDPVGDERNYVSQSINGILAKLRRWGSSSQKQVDSSPTRCRLSASQWDSPSIIRVTSPCGSILRETRLRSCQVPIALGKQNSC